MHPWRSPSCACTYRDVSEDACSTLLIRVLIVQGGSAYVQPDKTVHDPKTANGDLELGPNKPVTAPAEQKAVP